VVEGSVNVCNAESISSSSVKGRFSDAAVCTGFAGCGFGFGLPRSEVSVPGPFLGRFVDSCLEETIRNTLEGEEVRDGTFEVGADEFEGDIPGAVYRLWGVFDGVEDILSNRLV